MMRFFLPETRAGRVLLTSASILAQAYVVVWDAK